MTTRLDIINAMLAVNGEAPVDSATSTNPAAIQANNALTRIDKKVQARGWWFNKENITLSPSLTGEIILPQNTLSVDPVDTRSPYVQRGSSLYDRENNTRVIAKTVKCTLVLQLEIEDIPEIAATYIMDKAVKDHYTDDDGDAEKIRKLEDREAESFAYLQRAQLSNEDVNIRRSQLGARLLQNTRSNSTYIDTGA